MKIKTTAISLALVIAAALGVMLGTGATAVAEDDSTSTGSYTVTIPSTLSVENSGWNATEGISATGSLDAEKKLRVTASSDDEFALVSGENKIAYTLAAESDGEETTSWDFETLSDTVTTKPLGIIVDDYSTAPGGTYTDTVTFKARVVNARTLVEIITLDKTQAAIGIGGTESLTATIEPEDATDKTLTWSSDNTDVATVDELGVVTGVGKGITTIKATANDGSDCYGECLVIVGSDATWNRSNVFTEANQNVYLDSGHTDPLTYEGVTISYSAGDSKGCFKAYGKDPYDESYNGCEFKTAGDEYTFTAPEGKQFAQIILVADNVILMSDSNNWTTQNGQVAVWSGNPSNTVSIGGSVPATIYYYVTDIYFIYN